MRAADRDEVRVRTIALYARQGTHAGGPSGLWDGARHGDHAQLHVPFPDHDTALAASEDLGDKEPKQEDYASITVYRADHETWRGAAEAAEENDARQPASFAEWYLDRLAHEEPLTTPEQRRAAHRSRHAGVDTPIWLRWFDS
ncbi:hypothetical protein ABZ490_17590 [Streptomyces sp. NPDC005811]|uniref:hypothetical protein n=1 Tax=Streptomyces sp. NPDC005811 TaxID=3154565 RepID=UPI0033F5A1B3